MSSADCPGPAHPGGECPHGEEHPHELRWTEITRSLRVAEGQRVWIGPAGLRPEDVRSAVVPVGDWPGPIPPAPHGTTVETRLFGLPYRWVRQGGRLRLQRIETPPLYRELVRAHLDLADANPAFRGMRGE